MRRKQKQSNFTTKVRRRVNELVKSYYAGEITYETLVNEIFNAMLPIVYAHIASTNMGKNLTGYCDVDDVISQAKLGVLQALQRLDPAYRNPFSYIRVYMINAIRKLNARLVESGEVMKTHVGLISDFVSDDDGSEQESLLDGAAGGLIYNPSDDLFMVELRDFAQKCLTPEEQNWLWAALDGEELTPAQRSVLAEKLKGFFNERGDEHVQR